MNQPPPGSSKARRAGCTCPVFDNHDGKGAYIDDNGVAQFWINGFCPLHGKDFEQPVGVRVYDHSKDKP